MTDLTAGGARGCCSALLSVAVISLAFNAKTRSGLCPLTREHRLPSAARATVIWFVFAGTPPCPLCVHEGRLGLGSSVRSWGEKQRRRIEKLVEVVFPSIGGDAPAHRAAFFKPMTPPPLPKKVPLTLLNLKKNKNECPHGLIVTHKKILHANH